MKESAHRRVANPFLFGRYFSNGRECRRQNPGKHTKNGMSANLHVTDSVPETGETANRILKYGIT
jgi:hypothetical protein